MELTSTQELAQRLVRIKSITPNDNGCQELLSKLLSEAGFTCITLEDQGTRNLLALHGRGKPFSLCLGHTDVVPEGDLSQWEHDPYSGDIVEIDGKACLFGRGSTDMKSGVAAMAMALYGFLKSHPRHVGTIGLLVTSNEEGDAKGGTPFCAEYLKSHGLIPDYCLIAEPSSEEVFGDEIKAHCGASGITTDAFLNLLERCYGGFVFSDRMQKVFCPACVNHVVSNGFRMLPYSASGDYAFLRQTLSECGTDLQWLYDKDGQDPLFGDSLPLRPKGKQLGSLLIQLGFATRDRVTEHDLGGFSTWRYRFCCPNLDMEATLKAVTGEKGGQDLLRDLGGDVA